MTYISSQTLSDDDFKVRCHDEVIVVSLNPPREVWVVEPARGWGPEVQPHDIGIEVALAFAIATPLVSYSWNGAVVRQTHEFGTKGERVHTLIHSRNNLESGEDEFEYAQIWVLLPNYRDDHPWVEGSRVYWSKDTAGFALLAVQKQLQQRLEKQRTAAQAAGAS